MNYRSVSFVVAALFGTLTAIATPVSLTVSATADLQPGNFVSNSDTYTGAPDSLNSFAVAYTSNGASNVFSYAETANWTPDGNSGNILLQTTRNLAGESNSTNSDPTKIDYTFIADATGNFVLNYALTLSGNNTFGLNGVQLQFGAPSSPSYQYIDATSGSGQFVASLIEGNTYRLQLDLVANLYGQNLNNFDGTLVGYFTFSSPANNSVPDTTGTAGLVLASLAGLAALRRRAARS